MNQSIKKGSATVLAFLISPIIPVIAFPFISGFIGGEFIVDGGVFGTLEQFIFVYVISFLFTLPIALPAYFLLLFIPSPKNIWVVVIIGTLGGYFAALLNIGLETASEISVTAFCVTGILTGIFFWSILKAGSANVPS